VTRPAADIVKVEWSGTGTGTMSLGSAVSGFSAFPAALDGHLVSFSIEHQSAAERETGIGTYTHSGTTLSRALVTASTNGGSLVNFSAGTKHVRLSFLALDGIENRATTDPTTGDDFNDGYIAGRSRWLNTSSGTLWFCLDHTVAAAVWQKVAFAVDVPQLALIAASTVSGTTDTVAGSVFATWRRYTNVGTITVTLDADLEDDFEGVFVKDNDSATLTLVGEGSPSAWTFNGAETYSVRGTAVVKREGAGTDLTVLDAAAHLPLAGGTGEGGVSGFGRRVETRGDGSPADPILTTDSGKWIKVAGPVEIPNDAIGDGWFSCTLEWTGDFDIDFNGTTWNAGAASGDIADVQVLSASTIRITPKLLAADVIDEGDFA
jgi:hypothetical protein